MPPPRAVFVDGTGLIFRAWFALPKTLATTGGLPTNAAFGFAQMFRKIFAGRRPTHGAVVFDAGGSTFRHELDPINKAQRPPMPEDLREQLAPIDRLVRAHGFPILRIPDVEADDVIATLWRQALDQGMEVTVVSGDKDFAQLVIDSRVRQYDSTQEVFHDRDRIRRRFGVLPEQLADYLALVGDAADNIPGVPGIGPSTAAELLREHGTLEALLEHPETLSQRLARTLSTHAERARLSRSLALLRTDLVLPLTLDELALTPPGLDDLNTVYRELEFFSLLTAEAPSPSQQPEYFVCDTAEMAAAAIRNECRGARPVGVHVVHELEVRGAITGIALAPRPGRAMYFPLRGPGLVLDELGALKTWLEDPAQPKVVHGAVSTLQDLFMLGVEPAGVVGDTALASYLIDPTRHLPHRIEQVARAMLQRALQPLRGVIGSGRAQVRFDALTVDRCGAYACHLADATGALWHELEGRLQEEGMSEIHDTVDLPLASVLAHMERHGIKIDRDAIRTLGARFEQERGERTAELHRLAGRSFNPGSHKQVGTVLFDELGLPVIKRTKTGYSTAADVLDRLRSQHPIVEVLERWRTLDKLISTYTEVLVHSVDPKTGRIHTRFQQTASASGRLTTTDPDLQRTPVRSEEFRDIRRGIVAPRGSVILSADWSQIELRLLAHLSHDPALLEAFRTGADLHTATAAAIFGVCEVAISPSQRAAGKTVNFATIYGQGAAALSQQLSISHRDAKHLIDTFFQVYSGVASWRDRVVTEAILVGSVTTIAGRRRQVPELTTGNSSDRSHGERVAMSTPIQGSTADLCKVAMLRIDRALRDGGFAARMILQIHDELLFEVPNDEIEPVRTLVKHAMETAWSLEVPLVVEVGWGESWAEAH